MTDTASSTNPVAPPPDKVPSTADPVDDPTPAEDAPPVFTPTRLPGGPWRSYRSRKTVDAVFVAGAFRMRRPADGLVLDAADSWVVLDAEAGTVTVLDQSAFSAGYEAASD